MVMGVGHGVVIVALRLINNFDISGHDARGKPKDIMND
jgi:hypothetical protein